MSDRFKRDEEKWHCEGDWGESLFTLVSIVFSCYSPSSYNSEENRSVGQGHSQLVECRSELVLNEDRMTERAFLIKCV